MKLIELKRAAETTRRAAIMAAMLLCTTHLHATGLRTSFGEVRVRGLKIGQEYSLNNLINMPLRIINTGKDSEDIRIDVIAVASAAVAGYEPLPDLSWIKLDKNDFTALPNREAVTDIRISIPNDPKLLGRRFETHIWSRTKPSTHGMYGAGLGSILLLEISSVPPSEDELKKKFVDHKLGNLDFTLFPTQGSVENADLGREIDLKKENKVSIKLVNPNDTKINFRIKSIPFYESLLTMPDGFESAPQYTWVRASTETIGVEGNSIKDIPLILNIPDEDGYKGKSYAFILSVEVLEQEVSARVYYELMVKTRPKQVKTP
jgi:hypothetical protein